MSFYDLSFLLSLLIFLPCCFFGRVELIDERTIEGAEKQNGTQEQNEIETFVVETKAIKAQKQFQIEGIGGSKQRGSETQNISINGNQRVSCQCPSSKRNTVSIPQVREIPSVSL